MKKILVEYHSNNSGGDWWLDAEQWKSLEKAGWKLFAYGYFIYNNKGDYVRGKDGLPLRKNGFKSGNATYAYKFFDSIKTALVEFETITGVDITEEGCNCCGPPHTFSWEGGDCGGESCSEYLLGEDLTKLSKRELLKRLGTQETFKN